MGIIYTVALRGTSPQNSGQIFGIEKGLPKTGVVNNV
jgi:hypothetical protein